MWALKSPWISTFGICRNLLLYGNILFWLLSSTITTFITLQRTKINTSRLIHDRQWRNCVTTVTVAIWQSPKYNSDIESPSSRSYASSLSIKRSFLWKSFVSAIVSSRNRSRSSRCQWLFPKKRASRKSFIEFSLVRPNICEDKKPVFTLL